MSVRSGGPGSFDSASLPVELPVLGWASRSTDRTTPLTRDAKVPATACQRAGRTMIADSELETFPGVGENLVWSNSSLRSSVTTVIKGFTLCSHAQGPLIKHRVTSHRLLWDSVSSGSGRRGIAGSSKFGRD